jgi:hypothetical protein
MKSKSFFHWMPLAFVVMIFSCNSGQKKSAEGEVESITSSSSNNQKENAGTDGFTADALLDANASVLSGLDSAAIKDTNTLQSLRRLNRSWAYNSRQITNPISQWMRDEHINDSIAPSKVVFYPFSGPDFAFANAFYPDADEYILCGLERSGNDSALVFSKNLQPDSFIVSAEQYFFYSNRFGFFRTLDMEKQFEKRGVIDIISFYLKRAGAKIGDIKNYHWSPSSGTMSAPDSIHKPNACYFKFQLPGGKISSLYYFSKDLSDAGLSRDSLWLNWVEKESAGKQMVSLTKSASYLMHSSYFSIVRKFILEHAALHIQDDSGIDFAHLTKSGRKIALYGQYSGVIPLFKNKLQADLKDAYKNDSVSIKQLPFKIGYNLKIKETNLQVVYR